MDKKNQMIQNSYIKNFEGIFNTYLKSRNPSNLLDIGSGYGFVKKVCLENGISYSGVEADIEVLRSAQLLYDEGGFIHGFFPDVLNDDLTEYDMIVVLTCLDEVYDVSSFLSGIHLKLALHGTCYVALRNRDFFVNKLKIGWIKKMLKGRSLISLNDRSFTEWSTVLEKRFNLEKKGKYYRPLMTGFNFQAIKGLLYNFFSFFSPVKYSYMNYFVLSKKSIL